MYSSRPFDGRTYVFTRSGSTWERALCLVGRFLCRRVVVERARVGHNTTDFVVVYMLTRTEFRNRPVIL